jgi:hypothetical protein
MHAIFGTLQKGWWAIRGSRQPRSWIDIAGRRLSGANRNDKWTLSHEVMLYQLFGAASGAIAKLTPKRRHQMVTFL